MASVAKRKHRRRAVHRGQRPELKLNWCSYEGCQGIYEESETPQWSAMPSNVTDTSSTKTMEEHEGPSTSTPSEENKDEDDDTGVEYTLQENFFTSANPTTDRHRWLIAFYNHLNLPDGERKARNRLQHAAHIKTILEDLDPHGSDLEVLSRGEGYIVLTDWVDLKMHILKTGTINAYLGMYQKFLTFVVEERVARNEFFAT
ncbi:unnamed protein product [Porites evermanni]|uniref:Uncharacterized protein n=1 Tax=Porites evermanni TaxID=104178 RepID=A0ABN8PZZ8_9CNID|nr:unnamed protein product [Porites evermanni]